MIEKLRKIFGVALSLELVLLGIVLIPSSSSSAPAVSQLIAPRKPKCDKELYCAACWYCPGNTSCVCIGGEDFTNCKSEPEKPGNCDFTCFSGSAEYCIDPFTVGQK